MNEATVRIMCPKLTCRRILAVPVSARGKAVRCSGCGTYVKVPAPGTPGAPAAAAPAAPPNTVRRSTRLSLAINFLVIISRLLSARCRFMGRSVRSPAPLAPARIQHAQSRAPRHP